MPFSPSTNTERVSVKQIMLTTVEPAHHRRDSTYDAYEYTAHSHTYNTFEIPSAKAHTLMRQHLCS